MATPPKTEQAQAEEPRKFELTPSDLDEQTHAEMRLLYEDAARNVLFAKAQQWRTVGATLVVMAVLIAVTRYVTPYAGAYKTHVVTGTLLLSVASIVILGMYQLWQHNEHRKMIAIGSRFSNLFRRVRNIKSRKEANWHRYVLLAFMVAVVLLAAAFTLITIQNMR